MKNHTNKEGSFITEIEKMEQGKEYCFLDEAIEQRKEEALASCEMLNNFPTTEKEKRQHLIQNLFGSVGENVSIQPTFLCDYGKNIHVGNNFLTNYNVTILDIAPVNIGDDVMIGPNSLLTTVGHPLEPQKRKEKMGICKPINIKNNVWIGGNCTILPGVTIGENSIVAAGAVVTKDIPKNVIVAGVPAKVIKEL